MDRIVCCISLVMAKLSVENKTIEYNMRKSKRAKQVRLTVNGDGVVVATRPTRVPEYRVIDFIKQKFAWIQKRIDQISRIDTDLMRYDRKHYLMHKETARTLVNEKLEYWNKFYNFTYHKVAIRSQRTRWGSCSSKGNLNFNYKIIFLSPELQDYLIVHELCHLQEMNHGPNFWALVEKTVPDWKSLSKRINFRID
jgi:predicted metal-dependent hydrolase